MDVLLVEDDELVRFVLASAIEESGSEVAAAATAEDALPLLDGGRGPAVLVTDLNLGPGMDGLSLGELARRGQPELGILYITGEEFRLLGREIGPRERVLLKPFHARALLDAIRELTVGSGGLRAPKCATA